MMYGQTWGKGFRPENGRGQYVVSLSKILNSRMT